MAKRKRAVVVGVVLLVLLLAAGAWLARPRPTVFTWSGTIEVDSASVGSRTGGRVAELLVREGDEVLEGQPLLRFEEGDLVSRQTEAAAGLAAARARLLRLVGRGAGSARREEIAAARARLVEARAAADTARRDAARARTLAEAGAVPRVDAEHAQAEATAAEARAAEAMHGIGQLRKGTEGDVDEAAASVAAAEARIATLDVARSELIVRSPYAGQVDVLPLRPGDIVPPNAPTAVVVERGSLYLRLYVPETQLGFVRVDQRLSITVDSFPGRHFTGTVERINAVGEFSPRNLQTADQRADQVFATRVTVEDPHHVLKAGMAAFAEVTP